MKTKALMLLLLLPIVVLVSFVVLEYETTWLLTAIVGAVSSMYIIIFLEQIGNDRRDKEQKNKIKEIFGNMTQSFCEGTKMDETTLRRTYEVNNLNKSFESFADFLNNYLNTLLNVRDDRIHYGKNTENPDNKITYDDIDDILSPMIKKEKAEKPFEGVEERARKLLQDIDNASKDNNSDAVSSSLKYLSNILIENQKIYSKENRRNALLTKIGVIATIVGLVVAIIIFIIQNNRSLTGETIKKEMIEVIDSSVAIDTNNTVDYWLKYDNNTQSSSDQ